MKLFSRDAQKVNVIAMTYKVREEVGPGEKHSLTLNTLTYV